MAQPHQEHQPRTSTTSPESGLANLGRVRFDDAGRTVEVLVALTHAGNRGDPRR
jgi:hypothetical protein